jgi:RNA-directed DNA polymerase
MMVSLFSFARVHRAWLDCRKGKRNHRSALEFESRLEESLFQLTAELQGGTYQPGPSTCFITERPKLREIFAASFRDRVVHHLIVSHLNPLWEPAFIHDSCACRKEKGTHAAVLRVQSFFRKCSANGTRACWFLHADVRSFFMRIDKQILYDRLIARLRKRKPPWAGEMEWLLERVVFRDPAPDALRRGQLRLFDLVPEHKSLFHTANRTGLPIGNYTSQFFANVYLDVLDQYAKHVLKVPYYLRYVDDVVMVSRDRNQLEEWEGRMGELLGAELRLEWNPTARRLAPVSNGCDFLGYVVYRQGLRVRRRTLVHCREKLAAVRRDLVEHSGEVTCFRYPEEKVAALRAIVASYDGQFRHAGRDKIWNALLGEFPFLHFYLRRTPKGWRRRDAAPRRFSSLSSQYNWFAGYFRRCLMVFRIGAYYEFFGRQARLARDVLTLRLGRGRRGLGRGSGLACNASATGRLAAVAREFPVVVIEQMPGLAGNVTRRKLASLYWNLPEGHSDDEKKFVWRSNGGRRGNEKVSRRRIDAHG